MNELAYIRKILKPVPGSDKIKGIPFKSQTVYTHIFGITGHIFVTAYEDDAAFGYVILGNLIENAEWGWVPVKDMKYQEYFYMVDAVFTQGKAANVIPFKFAPADTWWRK